MRIPAYQAPPRLLELTADGYDLNGITSLRATSLNKYQPLPRRAACMDNLPAHYRWGLPQDVDTARRVYKAILAQNL